jgi:electron transfer flavoprotein beta subunit
MHVVVVLRLVPDTSEELEVAASGLDIDREWIGFKLCEFDDNALEEGVLLKERGGAHVTAVALAGDGVDRMLQTAIARGADRAVRVEHELDNPRDARAVTDVLAPAIKALQPDVVLTGVLTPEDVSGQLPPFLAGRLGWPTLNAVSGVKSGDGGLEVRQEYSGGRASIYAVSLPAVLGVQSATQPPRYVSGTKLKQALSAKIESLQGGSVGVGAAATLDSLAVPQRGVGAKMFEGDAGAVATQILEILTARGLIGV